MKYSVLGGLTVAVALSMVGAQVPVQAQDSEEVPLTQTLPAHATPLPESDPVANGATPPGEPESALAIKPSAATKPAESSSDRGVTVLPHPLDSREAATVYIRSIPVVTLVGNELASLAGQKSNPSASLATDPVVRAQHLVSRLENLAGVANPAEISARWDESREAYLVSWGEEDLIIINDQAILPDTTRNLSEDALQVANRLRRLLGNAPALARVEGLPEPSPTPTVQTAVVLSTLTGMASWYGPGFHGRRSASGEVFNQNALTAAHRTLPFGTRVRVTNRRTGQQVVVRINDRGPFSRGRIIDLSAAAAHQIGLRSAGVGQVEVEVLANQ
ncbi:MAG: septal ring lytic transglycosylase RlpA family protein [Cyanobacteriota bacterium]|nr:septal ring lytic transglycosylase RlpA family protein [Cyanobacteriota bacterium]